MKATREQVNSISGLYTFKSPYHENKRLPFNVLGYEPLSEYEVSVYTVEYRGRKKSDIKTVYKFEDVKRMIENGYLKPKKTK